MVGVDDEGLLILGDMVVEVGELLFDDWNFLEGLCFGRLEFLVKWCLNFVGLNMFVIGDVIELWMENCGMEMEMVYLFLEVEFGFVVMNMEFVFCFLWGWREEMEGFWW